MTELKTQSTDSPCVTLIGMAGAGKSTVGRVLARRMEWAHADTDHIIEAQYGRPLQDIFDGLGREEFIRAEERIVSGLGLKRTVVSTGGSVIYGEGAIEHLKTLGPIVHVYADLDVVRERVADPSGRGLAIAAGQTIDDLYNERRPLYERASDFTVDTGAHSPDACAEAVVAWLEQRGISI